jgi:peptidoglycan/xylan/chitin deacetylase (PgdA/CDA1 family)
MLSASELAARRDRARRRGRRRRLTAAAVLVAALVVVVAALLPGGGSGRTGVRRVARHPVSRAAPVVPTARAPTPRLPAIRPAVPGVAHVVKDGPRRNEIALTFDDGFCPACVARILRTLARTGAHATIFPNGTYSTSWDPQAKLVRTLVARGQLTVGNHTFLHHDALEESPAAFATDLENDERWIERTFGVTARPFFRPPYGAYDTTTVQIAGEHGYTRVIYWSGTLADSSPRSIPYILHAIRYWAHPGAIILAHGNYPNTSIALPQILAILKARGLRPVTLAELLGS